MEKQKRIRLYRALTWLTDRLERSRLFSSVRKGMLMLTPILVVGSVALMLRSFPIPAFQIFLTRGAGQWLLPILNLVYVATFGFLSVFLVLGVSWAYAAALEPDDQPFQLMSAVVGFSCFIASYGAADGSFAISYFGAVGIFSALLCAVAGTRIFHLLYRRQPRSFRVYAAGADLRFQAAFSMILPLGCTVLAFALGNRLLQLSLRVSNINDLVSGWMLTLFQHIDSDLGAGVLFILLLNLFWFFGIHGGNVMEQVSLLYLVPANTDPGQIISKSFLDNFSVMGGCGATLCLLLAMLLFTRSESSRRLARSAAPFALFNINEILVFGLPVILNPILLLPFLLVPILSLLISYAATAVGFLPVVVDTITWTTPALFSGFIASGSLRGVAVQLLCLAAGTAVYAPFVILLERIQRERESLLVGELTQAYLAGSGNGEPCAFLGRNDELGAISKAMAAQLRSDITGGRLPLWYQPQVDAAGRVAGAEALLRWRYEGQEVIPPLAVELSREDGSFDALTDQLLRQAARDIRRLREALGDGLTISVNVEPAQLNDPAFVGRVLELSRREGLAGALCLEITEDTSLERLDHISAHLERLTRAGVPVSIDDFSMGHTSLKYLQSNRFRYVKLDGSLVRQVPGNQRSRDIVRSITALGAQLGFEVVAEYVETQDLQDRLLELGCRYFQGYLYSPAIPVEKLADYCRRAPQGGKTHEA